VNCKLLFSLILLKGTLASRDVAVSPKGLFSVLDSSGHAQIE